MAGRRPFSIAGLMVVVLVMAGDFALIRFLALSDHPNYPLILMGLPMLNLLLLCLPRLRRGQVSRPFWLGFVAVGLAAIGMMSLHFLGESRFEDHVLFYPLIWFDRNRWNSGILPIDFSIDLAVIWAIYSAPQVLAATIAGWLSARYRVVIVRRPRASREGSAGVIYESPVIQVSGRFEADPRPAAGRV